MEDDLMTMLTLMPVELGFNLYDDLKGLPLIPTADEAKKYLIYFDKHK